MLTKKFVSKNYNATSGGATSKDKSSSVQSAPKAGGIAVFKGSTSKIGKTVGAAATPIATKAAPVPLNTPSVRRENNGRDPNVALVPVRSGSASGGNVWRAGGTSVDAPSADDASFPRPSAAAAQSSTAKPAPWARPTAATSNFAIRSQSPPAADAGADSVERRERSGSNLSASAGAAFAASLTSAGTVRPALPSARPNVKKWAEMDSDEENDGAEAPKPADEPVVEVTDDMRFTTSNSVGGLRDDAGGSGANYRMGNGYNDFGPRDRHNMHNQRYGGSSAGGGGGRFDDNGPRHYRREGYDDRDRSSGAYGAPYSGHNHSRMHSRHDEGFHGGMHGGEYQRNRQPRGGAFVPSVPTAVSAKDGPYKPGPPPIAGLSSSLRKDLGPRDTRMDSSPEEREERGGPSTAADKVTNSSPKLMSQDHRSMGGMPSAGPANFGDDQMAIERARRELELLQLQQHQLQSQLAQHEQRQQLMQMQQQQQQQQHHQQFQQQQQQQQLMHHQPIQQPFHSMGDSSMDPRSGSGSGGGSGRQFQQPYPQPEFAFGSDERSFDRFGQRPGAHSFGPPMHAGPADFDQRVQLDQQHRNMHFDQRGSFDQRGPFDARRAADRDFGGSGGGGGGRPDLDLRGGFYSKSGGFDRFQQRSSADAEPLWERAKRLPVDHQSNANSANHSDSNSAGGVYDAQFSPAETNAHAFDSRAAFGAPSEQPLPLQQHRPAATEPPTVILVNSERARDQHQSKPAAASAHVETGRSFASLFPGTQADSAERSQIDRPETSEQQEMIPHVNEAEYDVHKSDFFTHDSYREAPPAYEGSEDMPRNDSHEPKKRMLFDPKSSKFVDSSLISDAEKRKRSDSGKFVVKSGPRGREDKVMRADADRSEPRADGKWVKRTLGPQAGEAEGANPNPAIATTTAPPPLPPPRVLQRRAEGGREKPVREDASAQQEAVDLSHATMIVGNNMFPTTGRHLTPQQFQEYLAQRKELREKERARRGPRTKGMLFRYNERSEIERVLNDEERANMIARNEAKQLKLVAGKSDKHAKKRTAHGGEGREADGDDSSDGNGNNEAFGDKLYSARAADHALGRDMHHHQQQAAHSLEHDMGDDRRHSLIHTASGSRVSSPGGAAASGMGLANTQQGPPVYALNQSQMHNSDAFYRDLQLMPHAPSSPFENANFYSGLEVDPADAAIMGVQAYSSNRNVIAPHSVGIFSQQVNAVPAANDDMNIFLVMDSGIGDLDIQKMAAEADANRARQPIKSFIPGVGLAMDNAQMPMHAASVGGNWNYAASDVQWGYEAGQAPVATAEIKAGGGDDVLDAGEEEQNTRTFHRNARGTRSGGRGRSSARGQSTYGSGSGGGGGGGGGRYSESRGGGKGKDAAEMNPEADVAEGLFASIIQDAGGAGGRGGGGRSGGTGRSWRSSGGRGGRSGRAGGSRYISGPPQIDPATGERLVFKNKHYKQEDASSSPAAKAAEET